MQEYITSDNISQIETKIKNSWFMTFAPLVFMILVVIYNFIDDYNFKETLRDKTLFECESKTGGINIVVDKKEGWILKDNYFIKGESKIDANLCNPKEKNNE